MQYFPSYTQNYDKGTKLLWPIEDLIYKANRKKIKCLLKNVPVKVRFTSLGDKINLLQLGFDICNPCYTNSISCQALLVNSWKCIDYASVIL